MEDVRTRAPKHTAPRTADALRRAEETRRDVDAARIERIKTVGAATVSAEADVVAIVLYGSRARTMKLGHDAPGSARPDSDWDLAVILRDSTRKIAAREALEDEIAGKIGHQSHCVCMTKAELWRRANVAGAIEAAIVREGIELAGSWTRPEARERGLTVPWPEVATLMNGAAAEMVHIARRTHANPEEIRACELEGLRLVALAGSVTAGIHTSTYKSTAALVQGIEKEAECSPAAKAALGRLARACAGADAGTGGAQGAARRLGKAEETWADIAANAGTAGRRTLARYLDAVIDGAHERNHVDGGRYLAAQYPAKPADKVEAARRARATRRLEALAAAGGGLPRPPWKYRRDPNRYHWTRGAARWYERILAAEEDAAEVLDPTLNKRRRTAAAARLASTAARVDLANLLRPRQQGMWMRLPGLLEVAWTGALAPAARAAVQSRIMDALKAGHLASPPAACLRAWARSAITEARRDEARSGEDPVRPWWTRSYMPRTQEDFLYWSGWDQGEGRCVRALRGTSPEFVLEPEDQSVEVKTTTGVLLARIGPQDIEVGTRPQVEWPLDQLRRLR